MSKDPKNSNITPEDLWVKALTWAKSKLPDNSSNIIDNKT